MLNLNEISQRLEEVCTGKTRTEMTVHSNQLRDLDYPATLTLVNGLVADMNGKVKLKQSKESYWMDIENGGGDIRVTLFLKKEVWMPFMAETLIADMYLYLDGAKPEEHGYNYKDFSELFHDMWSQEIGRFYLPSLAVYCIQNRADDVDEINAKIQDLWDKETLSPQDIAEIKADRLYHEMR